MSRKVRNINEVITEADSVIQAQVDKVTAHVRKVLIAGGIPAEIAYKYSAEENHGGEWLLNDDEGELASHDYQLLSNDYIVSLVKELEDL